MINFKKEQVENIRQILFVGLFSFPMVPIKIINVLFFCFSILTLILYLKEKPKFIFSEFKFYGFFMLPFLPYITELLLYHSNPVVQFEFEKKLLFFIAPIIFYLSFSLSSKIKIENAINCLIGSVSILSILSFFSLLFLGNLFSPISYQNGAFELRRLFEEFSRQHPIYYGLYSSTASLWIIYNFNIYSKNLKWLLGISLFFMLFMNFLVAAKMPLIILVLGVLWIAYKKVNSLKKLLFIYTGIIIGLISISFLVPSLRNRLIEVYNYGFGESINNTLAERSMIFSCSKNIFLQDFFTGIGCRNTQGVLDYCYIWVKFYKGWNFHFNSHNQFLTLGINYGIGIIALFTTLLVMLYRKINNHPLGFIYFCSVVLIMFTESILERQMGIYYFLFFGLLFVTTTYNKKATTANPK